MINQILEGLHHNRIVEANSYNLPTIEEFNAAEADSSNKYNGGNGKWEYLNGDKWRLIYGDLRVGVNSDIQFTPKDEASYWYTIYIKDKKVKESSEYAAAKNGKEKCWKAMYKAVETVLKKYNPTNESYINEISKLDLINQNKKKYEYVQNNASKLIKDKTDKAITDTLILRWIKGRNWEGGLGAGKDIDKMCDKLMSDYGLGADNLGDRLDKLMDFWEAQFKKANINESIIINEGKVTVDNFKKWLQQQVNDSNTPKDIKSFIQKQLNDIDTAKTKYGDDTEKKLCQRLADDIWELNITIV